MPTNPTHYANLTAREAAYIAGLDDGDEFVIVSVVEPQPHPITDAMRDDPGVNDWWAATVVENEWGTEYHCLGSDYQWHWPSPFGVPGDVLMGREPFQVGAFDDDPAAAYSNRPHGLRYVMQYLSLSNTREQVYYPDDALYQDAKKMVTCYADEWRSREASTMPDWAIRIRAVTREVRCVRVGDVTWNDFRSAGFAMPKTLDDVRIRDQWDIDNPSHPFDSNPYVWVGRFAKQSEAKESR